jgi:hypothetical protein
MAEPTDLILERFCGRETHPVVKATWNVYHDGELDMPTLCLQVRAGRGAHLHDDTSTLNAEPSWEINVVGKSLSGSSLKPGDRFVVPAGHDEQQGGYVTNFYYCSHEQTDDNVVEILAVEGSRVLARLTGQTIDVNYYDGSKPPTLLSVQVWFAHDPDTKRSMS